MGFGMKEMLAPARITIMPDNAVISGEYVRTIVVSGYPSQLPVGWLGDLVTYQDRVDVSMHIRPLEREYAITFLNSEVSKIQVELIAKAHQGKVDTAELDSKLQSAITLRDKIAGRCANLFSTALYITVRADTKKDLDKLTKEVSNILKGIMVKTRQTKYQMEWGFRSNLPTTLDTLNSTYTLDTQALASTFPFISSTHIAKTGILLGMNVQNNTPVILDRFELESYNTLIFGQSGSGKSYAAKLELMRHYMLSPETQVFIIDPMNEFGALTEALGGQVVNVGPGGDAINPMDMDSTGSCHEKIKRLKVLFSTMFDLSQDEVSVLDTALLEVYAKNKNPTLTALQTALQSLQNIHARRIENLLTPHTTGTMNFMNRQTSVNLRKRLVTFNISSLDEDEHPAMMFLILDYIYSRIRKDFERKIIVIDEAWNLMQKPDTAQFIANLSRHTRHYNTGLTLISQTAEDFLDSEHGQVVMKNSAVALLMRHRHVSEEMVEFYRLTDTEKKYVLLAKTGKETGYSEGLLLTGSVHIPLQVLASETEHGLVTTNPDEVKVLNGVKP
jgi:type IV secretory pathway VirB4 component